MKENHEEFIYNFKLISISCETELLDLEGTMVLSRVAMYSSSPLSSRTKEKHEEVIIIKVIK